jgi:hypothetical protein
MSYHAVPYERNPFFAGREHLLAELDAFFTSALPIQLKIVALLGMPGGGKTEMALEYVYRIRSRYQVVVWLDASTRESLPQNITQALNTFGVRLPRYDDNEWIYALFRAWLRRLSSSFLLVLDRIHDDSLLNNVLDKGMKGHVIVTKSTHLTTDELRTLIIKPFTQEEGPLFLLRRAGLLAPNQPPEQAPSALYKAASALHREFGGHPLALDQAGAYLSETGVSPAEYLRLYRQDRRVWLDRRGTTSASHPFSAYAVIAAMRQGYAAWAEELLSLYLDHQLDCSDPSPHLPSSRVPAHLCQLAETNPALLFHMRASLIQNFVLVPLDPAHGKWGMHPLVRTVLREVRAYQRAQDRRNQAREDCYEPLTEEGIFQLLIAVQQLKHQQATMQQESAGMSKLAHESAMALIYLMRAVLPAPRKQREQAKKRIEYRYSTLVWDVSEEQLRDYARELLVIMQDRS